MATSWQTVRVFISSTFRDMQAERDHLVKVVFPALRERLEPYRVHLIDIDLRWGVTKEQAENDQVLDLCLQQIDECRPFFIGLLGERYGWVPTSFPQDALSHYGWIQHHTGKSVTELEMLYGVLTNPEMENHAFFYFRDPTATAEAPEEIQGAIYLETDLERKNLLADLKARIRTSGFPVMDPYPAHWDSQLYDRGNKVQGRVSGLREFGKEVEQQLWRGIKTRLALPGQPPTVTLTASDPLTEEQEYHERLMASRLRVYVGRGTFHEKLEVYAKGKSAVPCLVTGPSGSGKSAALAYFSRSFQRKNPDILVIPHFIGASPESTSLRQMLRRFCMILNARFGSEEEVSHDPHELVMQFRTGIGLIPESEKVVFVIDALNQLDETDNAHAMYWLPRSFPTNVKIVVSCIVDPEKKERVLDVFNNLKHERVTLEPLKLTERHAIVRRVPSLSAKTLDDTQVDQLLENPATANPLFLLVALEELRGFGSFEELNSRIAQFPQKGDTVTALFMQVIDRLEGDFDKQVVRKALTLLVCSRHGLSQHELLELIEGGSVEESTSDLFPILRQVRPYLQYRGALFDCYHRNFFIAVKAKYLDKETERNFHQILGGYFQRKADPEENGTWSGGSHRGISMFPYHFVKSHQWDELNSTLLNFRFLQAKTQQLGVHSLLDDFALARKEISRARSNKARSHVGEALYLSTYALLKDPGQLPSQLHGRLLTQKFKEMQVLLDQAKEWTKTPWLRPFWISLTPPGGSLIHTFAGHSSLVNAVALTSDGGRAITGSDDDTVKIWDIVRGKELLTLRTDTNGVLALAATPDSERVVTGSRDGTVKVWDLTLGAELFTLRGHTGIIEAVTVTPDGKRAISGSRDHTVKVWDLNLGEELFTLQGHTGIIWTVAVTSDGRRVLTVSEDHTVKVWDLVRGREDFTLTSHTAAVSAISITPDDQRAVTGSQDGIVKVWDLVRGREDFTLTGHTATVSAISVTPDGQRAVTGSHDGTVKVWDLFRKGDPLTLKGATYPVEAVAVTPDGQWVITTAWFCIEVWNLDRGVKEATLRGHTDNIYALALTPDGQRAVTGSDDGTVKVWDLKRGRKQLVPRGHSEKISALAVTSDGQRAITGSWDHTVKVWDLTCGKTLMTYRVPPWEFPVAVTPDARVAILDRGLVWDLVRGIGLFTLRVHTGFIKAVAVTPDGQRAVAVGGNRDNAVKVWDLGHGKEHLTLWTNTNGVSAVAVTPDGKRVVTGSGDGTVKVWDAGDGEERLTIRGHTDWVSAVAVTPDAKLAVTARWNHPVKVWDLIRGEELFTLKGQNEAITAVAVTPNGEQAVSASINGTVKVWDLFRGVEIASIYGEGGCSSCAVSPDGSTIIVGGETGTLHFLRLEGI